MEDPTASPNNPQVPFSGTQFPQQNLPNATAVLVLGILSLVFICPYLSLIGIVLGIIAIVLAGKDQALYTAHPTQYTLSSFNNIKAGRICAIIGLSIAVVTFVISILFIVGIIATATLPFWGMVE